VRIDLNKPTMELPYGADVLTFRPDGKQFVVGCTDHYGEVWQGTLVLYSVDGDEIKENNQIGTYTGVTG